MWECPAFDEAIFRPNAAIKSSFYIFVFSNTSLVCEWFGRK